MDVDDLSPGLRSTSRAGPGQAPERLDGGASAAVRTGLSGGCCRRSSGWRAAAAGAPPLRAR